MRNLIIAATVLFTAFTAWVVAQTGLVGFYRQLLASPAGWQVLVDISIALVLVLSWVARDARRTGRRFLPYLVLTLGLGSIGPLLYLVLAPRAAPNR
jgi:Terpene cyclase DEP1